MELLTSLGVNSSLAVQFGIFLVCYAILKRVLFDPYFAAFDIRSARTVGTTELAEKYLLEKRELEKKFAARALEANEAFRRTFDAARREAQKEYDRVVGEAQAKSKKLIDDTGVRLQREVASARSHVQSDVATVSQMIGEKLLGREGRS